MTRIALPEHMNQNEQLMAQQMAMMQARQEQILQMHFGVALNLFTRWSKPEDIEGRQKYLAEKATDAATVFMKRYGYDARIKPPAEEPVKEEGEASGAYVSQ